MKTRERVKRNHTKSEAGHAVQCSFICLYCTHVNQRRLVAPADGIGEQLCVFALHANGQAS